MFFCVSKFIFACQNFSGPPLFDSGYPSGKYSPDDLKKTLRTISKSVLCFRNFKKFFGVSFFC